MDVDSVFGERTVTQTVNDQFKQSADKRSYLSESDDARSSASMEEEQKGVGR